MDIDNNLEELLIIEKRIDTRDVEDIRDRWESGLALLKERVKRDGPGRPGVPKKRMEELVQAIGKSPAELSWRMQFAEQYPSEANLSNALEQFTSWRQVVASLKKPPMEDKQPKSAPSRHKRHDEVVELSEQGKTYREIAEDTGIGERQVRHIVERAHIEQKAKAQATPVDWATIPKTSQEKLQAEGQRIRRELQAQFETRVHTEVQRRLEVTVESYRALETTYRRVLDGRKGIITRDEYDLIRSCLHPDSRRSATDEKLAEAFRVFNEAKILFLDEKSMPTVKLNLPSTEELMRRRKRA